MNNLKLICVDALEATATQLLPAIATVVVAQKACRNELNVAMFGLNGKTANRLIPNQAVSDEQLLTMLAQTTGEVILTGDATDNIFPLLKKRSSKTLVRPATGLSAVPTAAGVAALAWPAQQAKQFQDPVKAMPVYSHPPNIKLSTKIDYATLKHTNVGLHP